MSLLHTPMYLIGILGLVAAGCLAANTATGPSGAGAPATPPAANADANTPSNLPAGYKGTPFTDEKYKDGAQKIPGKVMCAYYDRYFVDGKDAGEGVTYHVNGTKNHGSGELNPLNGQYLNEFRHTEAVSTSYTKDFADLWEGEAVKPALGMFYIGWTDPGNWYNITINATEAGTYTIDLLSTCNHGAQISFDVNGKAVGKPIDIPFTGDPKDTTAWRQWHHWAWNKDIAEVTLPKGLNLITVHVVKEGNMNLGILDFELKPAAK